MTPDQLARVLRDLPDTALLTLSVPELRGLLSTETMISGMSAPKRDLTSSEVAAYYRISSRTLARWRKEGRFEGAFRLGSRWRYPPASLVACDRWISQGGQETVVPGPAVGARDLTREEVDALRSWRKFRKGDGDEKP